MSDQADPIAELTKGFTGRAWVFEKIDAWLGICKSRLFLLTGGPGTGKSTLAARLVQMSRGEIPSDGYPHLAKGAITFFQFCQALNDPTLDALRFVRALSLHLAGRYEPFALALKELGDQQITIDATQTVGTAADGSTVQNVVIESLHIGNVSARIAFDRIVRRPLEQLYATGHDAPIVILVDALDEALTYADDNIASLLRDVAGPAASLSPQVRFILTGRPDPRLLDMLGEPSLDLLADAPDDVDDVRAYACGRLHMLAEPQREELARRIAEAGEGNFLYARYVLDDLPPDIAQVQDLSSLPLPEGLKGVYREFLERELTRRDEQWASSYRPLLGALAVARGRGLMREQLGGICDLPQSEADDRLRACTQYLAGPQPGGPFRIYHQSFRGFLLSDEKYQVYPAEANRAIAQFFLEEYEGDWLDCADEYALRYTPAHLVEAIGGSTRRRARRELTDSLAALLMDLSFLETKSGQLGPYEVMGDLRTVLKAVSAEDLVQAELGPLREVFAHEIQHLFDWNQKMQPTLFATQIHNRATVAGLARLANEAKSRLENLAAPHLLLVWRVTGRSVAGDATFRELYGAMRSMAITPFGQWLYDEEADEYSLGRCVMGRAMVKGTYTNCPQCNYDHLPEGARFCPICGQAIDLKTSVSVSSRRLKEVMEQLLSLELRAPIADGFLTEVETARPIMTERGGQVIKYQLGPEAERVFRSVLSIIGTRILTTPVGRRAISTSTDGELEVWDLITGEQESTLGGHDGLISALAITSDAQWAITGSHDGAISKWDLQARREEQILGRHGLSVSGVVVTPDDRHAISGSADETLKIWNLQSGQEELTLHHQGGAVLAVTVTPGGREAIWASADGTLGVWDLGSGQLEHTLREHEDTVYTVAVTPDGQRAISASADHTLKTWNLQTGTVEHTLKGHTDTVYAVVVALDGALAVSASFDGLLKVWDLETGEEAYHVCSGQVLDMAVMPDGKTLVTTSWGSNALRTWDLQTGRELATTILYGELGRLSVAPDARSILVSDMVGNIYCLHYVDPRSS